MRNLGLNLMLIALLCVSIYWCFFLSIGFWFDLL